MAPHTRGARRRHASRTPFVLLVVGLLAGGLVCLLVINTTLAAGSYQISRLQQDNSAASQRLQQLQQQVTAEQAPASIQQRALKLGMRTQPVLNFVDLGNDSLYSTAANLPPEYAVPGYTP
jgi:endonuclease/exonuclease/phosphatase (EEP) superfamily protein YafD